MNAKEDLQRTNRQRDEARERAIAMRNAAIGQIFSRLSIATFDVFQHTMAIGRQLLTRRTRKQFHRGT